MHVLFGLLVALSAAVAHGLPSTHIVGGVDAGIGEFPYIVSLRENNRHFCGGSIISKRHILTAAHCILRFRNPDSLGSLSIHAGTNFRNVTGYRYTVEKATPHANFSMRLLTNDIGVLRLKRDIMFNNLVRPLPLATTKFVNAGDSCVLSGWGRLWFGGAAPNKLQKLYLKVFSQASCSNEFWQVKDSHVCAFSKYGQGACHGDSGSPLVARGTQIGLASFVRPCAVGFPDVYTRVSAFKDWIAKNTK